MESSVHKHIAGDILQISIVNPRLDASSSAEIKKDLKMEPMPGITRADVEIGSVQFIDSSGIGLLLSIYRQLPEGAQVNLLNVQPGVRAVLQLLRLHRCFTIA